MGKEINVLELENLERIEKLENSHSKRLTLPHFKREYPSMELFNDGKTQHEYNLWLFKETCKRVLRIDERPQSKNFNYDEYVGRKLRKLLQQLR